MPILHRYLARLFSGRLTLLMLGFTALVLLLDLLANGQEVLESSGNEAGALIRYMALRLPEIVSALIPFGVLLAGIATLASLVRNSELVAMRAAGISQVLLIKALTPVALLVAVPQFWLENDLLPASVAELRAWGVGDYDATGDEEGRVIWARLGEDIVRVGEVRGPESLADVAVFRRDARGNLVEQVRADRAVFEDGSWTFLDVKESRAELEVPTTRTRENWPSLLSPSLLASLSTHPRELPVTELRSFMGDASFGNRPTYLYEVWFHKKISAPVATILMLFISVPLIQGLHRRAGTALMLAAGVAIGFSFLVFDGLILKFGEAGLLPPLLAAWGPTVIFAMVAASLAFRTELY